MKKPKTASTILILCLILGFILFPGLLYLCIAIGTLKAISHAGND